MVAHSQRTAKNWSGARCANMGAPSSGPWNQYSSWMSDMSMAVVLRMLRSLRGGTESRVGQTEAAADLDRRTRCEAPLLQAVGMCHWCSDLDVLTSLKTG